MKALILAASALALIPGSAHAQLLGGGGLGGGLGGTIGGTVGGTLDTSTRGTVAPGMPVMTPEGASLGKVRQVVANGRGEIEQVVVKQGKVTRTLPAGMFSASGNALVAGNASGNAVADSAQPAPATDATGE